MKPLQLNLRRFKSYIDANIDFSSIDIALLSGDNGAGKSSLLDAFLFALYSKKHIGLDDVVTDRSGECQVEFSFELNGQIYRIIRNVSSNGRTRSTCEFHIQNAEAWQALTGNSLAETEEKIEKLLGLSYSAFTAASFFLQGRSDAFTKASPAQRKEILAEILSLDIYSRLEEAAKNRTREREQEVVALKAEIQRLAMQVAEEGAIQGELQQRQENLRELQVRLAEREKAMEQKRGQETNLVARVAEGQSLKTQIASLEDDVRSLTGELARLTEKLENLGAIIAKAAKVNLRSADVLQNLTLEFEDIKDAGTEGKVKIEQLNAEKQKAQKRLVLLEQNQEATCSECGRPLPSELKTQIMADIQNNLTEMESGLADLIQEQAFLATRYQELQAEMGQVQAQVALLEDARQAKNQTLELTILQVQVMSSLEQKRETLEKLKSQVAQDYGPQLLSLKEEIAALTYEIKELGVQISYAQSAVGASQERLEQVTRAKEAIKSIEEQSKALQAELLHYQLLQKAFGKNGIPLLIIENSVAEIEQSANELLGRMLPGYSVTLRTQKELKTSDRLADTLDIIISDRSIERSYETYSGGQKFLIDFSLRLAISRLLTKRAGATIDTLVIDEGISALDGNNRDHILIALQEASRSFSKVLVISHVTEIKNTFDSEIFVYRDDNGSHAEVR